MKPDFLCDRCNKTYRLNEFGREETYFECNICGTELTPCSLYGIEIASPAKQIDSETSLTPLIPTSLPRPWTAGCLYSFSATIVYILIIMTFAIVVSSLQAIHIDQATEAILIIVLGVFFFWWIISAFIWGYYKQTKENRHPWQQESHRPVSRPTASYSPSTEEGNTHKASYDSRQGYAYPEASEVVNASTQERHIFLSYSSQDRHLALELKDALEAYGVNVWIDVDRMRPGSFIVTELEEAIGKASAFVVLITDASLSSGWVREEYGRAINLSIQSTFRFPIIPIVVEGATIPGFLANRRALQLPARSHLPSVAALIAAELSNSPIAVREHQRRTQIRWHSRCEDFANGDVSVLAILETVAAVAAIIILSMYSGSFTYVITLALIAPLAMLQTDQSRSSGIRLFSRLQWWTFLKPCPKNDSRVAKTIRIATPVFLFLSIIISILSYYLLEPSLPPTSLLLSIIFLFITLLFIALSLLVVIGMTPPLLVRFTATLFSAIRHPITTLQAMPTNWKNMVLSKDLLEEPEVIPGYQDAISTGELSSDLRFPNFLKGIARRPLPNIFPKVFCDVGVGGFLHYYMISQAILPAILLYVPFYATRWALKSTAIIWSPLLWIASSANGSTLPLRLRLKIIAEDATSRTVFAFSWLALFFILALWFGLLQPPPDSLSDFSRIILFLQRPLPGACILGAALIAISLRLIASRILLLYSYKTMPWTAISKTIYLAAFIQRLMVLLLIILFWQYYWNTE